MIGQQTLDQLNALEPDPERPAYFKGYNKEHAWTHKTCFWDLPYFKDLLCPHNIDMMHTEKNIAEAIFGTLFGIEGKSKDNTKARVDQEELCDRPSQNMQEPKGKRNWKKPKARFNLMNFNSMVITHQTSYSSDVIGSILGRLEGIMNI